PDLYGIISEATSSFAIGRRYARRASVVTIVAAHASSSAGRCGRQTKIFRRVAVSPGPVASYGPAIEMVPTPSKNAWSPAVYSTPSGFTVSFTNVAATR